MFVCLHTEQPSYHAVFIKYYSKLTDIVQIKHFVDYFVSERIISVKDKDTVTLDSLLKVLESQLKNGINKSFTRMLDILEQHGDLGTESLAKNIKRELHLEISMESTAQTTAVDFSNFDDVELMFTALVSGLRNILSEDTFPLVHLGCICNNKTLKTKYSSDFIDEINATSTLHELFTVVKKSPYCNWMNVDLLEKMAVASCQPTAHQLVNNYKKAVSAKRIKDVFDQMPEMKIPQNYYSKVKEKWHKEFNDVTVKDVIGHWSKLEKIFDVEKPSLLLDRIIEGCVEFHWLIPSDLVCHARYSVLKNWNHLNDIMYLDICDHVIKDSQYNFSTADSKKGDNMFS